MDLSNGKKEERRPQGLYNLNLSIAVVYCQMLINSNVQDETFYEANVLPMS